jgi:hypothetical protein
LKHSAALSYNSLFIKSSPLSIHFCGVDLVANASKCAKLPIIQCINVISTRKFKRWVRLMEIILCLFQDSTYNTVASIVIFVFYRRVIRIRCEMKEGSVDTTLCDKIVSDVQQIDGLLRVLRLCLDGQR